ncbi:MAG: acyltransferase [Gallionella sp.]|nr:acyltransferase [Gallionella sp.]MDD4946146.1 acyltransferase [Gallionella sp.]
MEKALLKHGSYYQYLDSLRGIAIVLVILHHVSLHFPGLQTDALAEILVRIGWSGVDIFFAISGFLITKILLEANTRRDIKRFFIKRFFRIVPLYFTAILIYYIFGTILHDANISRLWMSTLFLTGWALPFLGREAMAYVITWSLSVEESAYLCFGFIATLGRQWFTRILFGLIVLALLLRWLIVTGGWFELQNVYYFPPTRIDSIAFGGLVALNIIKGARGWRPVVMIGLLVVLLYYWLYQMGQYDSNVAIFGYTALAFTAALVVAYAIKIPNGSNPLVRILTHIGQRSYFVYLMHVFVIGAAGLSVFSGVVAAIGYWGLVACIVLATMIMAEFSWRYFEYPLICFGRKIASSVR